jgi:hypothetical protein
MRCVGDSLYQSHDFMTNVRPSLLLAVLLPLVLVGCDAAGGDTATFTVENTPPGEDDEPPVADYLFEYDSDDQVDGQELVEVVSESSDNLGDALRKFNRSDIVSARIESVNFIRVSPDSETSSVPKFALDNLRRATVVLGTSDSGVQIADGTFDPNDDADEVPLTVTTSDVTSTVKNGSTKAFLRLETDGDITRTDRVRVKVFYEITVSL